MAFHSQVCLVSIAQQDIINPLTTNNDYSHHRNLAACYQLAQSVLKIGYALAERVGQGEVGGCTALADSAWRLLQLAKKKGLVSAGCPILPPPCANGRRKRPFHLVGVPFLAL